MKRLNINILGISETIRTGNGRVDENYEIIYAGEDRHGHEVGLQPKSAIRSARSFQNRVECYSSDIGGQTETYSNYTNIHTNCGK